MSEHKLVPVEPTQEMIDAAREHHEGEAYLPVSVYKAMLATAPDVQGDPDVARHDAMRFALSEMVKWYENISLGNNPAFQYYNLAKKALLSAAPQPAPCRECGGDGAGGEHEDDCAMAQPEQPECGCCGRTDRCDDDCDAVVIGGHRAAEQQPAPQTEMLDDDSLARQIGEVGNQIHNLGCEHQNDEGLADRLAEIAHQAWMLQRSVMVSKQQPAPDVDVLVTLLEHARCNTCDGSGAVYDGHGQAHQCQWCHDRSEALAAHRKQGVEP